MKKPTKIAGVASKPKDLAVKARKSKGVKGGLTNRIADGTSNTIMFGFDSRK